MFAATRKPAVLSLGAMLTASMFVSHATAQSLRGPMPSAQAAQPAGMRNSSAPNRPNILGLRGVAGQAYGLGVGASAPIPAASGQGGSDGGSSGSGGSSEGSGSQAQPTQSEAPPPFKYVSPYDLPEDSKSGSALATYRAYGGGLNWPIGLRTLEPAESMKELREQMDGVVEAILRQPAKEPASADLVKSGLRGIERMARQFERIAYDMPLSRTQEKDTRRFIRNVYAALKAMEPATTESEVKTAK